MENRAPSSNGESRTSFDDLPPEAAVNIFSRLPVKTLIRSTLVSKTWYSRITNPEFVSAQISRSISCFNKNAVFVIPTYISDKKYCSLISADKGYVLDKYEIPFNTRTGTLKLVGSLNGILCLNDFGTHEINYCEDYKELYLWNPSLKKYKSLLSSCFKKRGESSYAIGLGFHEPTHDFRIVRVMYPEDDMGCLLGKLPPKVEIFSLRMNKWRNIKNPVVPRVAFECGTTVDNSMTYWLDTKRSKNYFEDGWLVSFDFNNEVFGQIKLPDDVRYCLGLIATFKLMKFEGSLSVCVFNEITEKNGKLCQPCCIWLMRHEDGIVSWTLLDKVVFKEHVWPLGFSRNGTLLMLSKSRLVPGLVSCNLKSKHGLRLSKPLVIEPSFVDASFTESLLMLEGRAELFAK